MQQSVATNRSFRRALLVLLALAISVLVGIGIASAASAGKRTQPALAHPFGLVAPRARRQHAGAHAQHASVGLGHQLVGRSL